MIDGSTLAFRRPKNALDLVHLSVRACWTFENNEINVMLGQALLPLGRVEKGEIFIRPDGDEHIGAIAGTMMDTIRIFSVELRIVAELLDVTPIFGGDDMVVADFEEAQGETLTTTLRDLLLTFYQPLSAPERFVTQAGQEYAELRRKIPDVAATIAPFAIWP